ncbi:class I adenylate cyclase [Providencia huaxiensis]
MLSQLVESWGWGAERLSILDTRNQWKIERVREAQRVT